MIVPKFYKPGTISFTDALKLKSVVHIKNLHKKAFFPALREAMVYVPLNYRFAGLLFSYGSETLDKM